MDFIHYLILIASVLLGGAAAFYFKKSNRKVINALLSFSGAYLLGIIFLHILPETYEAGGYQIGVYILLGYIIQLLLEYLSQGIEHGHIHPAHKADASFVVSIMLGLCGHAFMEGLPLSGYVDLHHHENNHFLFGIVIHKIPAAFALGLLMILSGFRNRLTFICLSIFALMTPLGALTTGFLQQVQYVDQSVFHSLIGIVIGSFLHISTTIIFEANPSGSHKLPKTKLFFILLGFLIAGSTMHTH